MFSHHCKKRKNTNKGGNSCGSPMHVYLRTFLSCEPTEPMKAFVINGLNIYCLVRPAELLGWAGGCLGGGGALPSFLVITLTSAPL